VVTQRSTIEIGRGRRSVVWGRKQRIGGVALAGIAALLLLVSGAPSATAQRDGGQTADGQSSDVAQSSDVGQSPSANVLVFATSSTNARIKVNQEHGKVKDDLWLVDAVSADLTQRQIDDVQLDGDAVVIPNLPVEVSGVADVAPRSPAAVFPATTGASTLAASGNTGAGVAVAVLDTGISPLADFAGRIVGGVDYSGEGNPYQDSYGHGTFVSGLIAGNGASSAGTYTGEAPGASLVSIKVAGASGVTDLARVVLGIQWAIVNKQALNIGVLNISMGTPPFPSSVYNPLDRAVEAAWRNGIVVVASAGNTGPFNGTITSPGDDPLVVTAGALDDKGTAPGADDTMTDFSAVGPTAVDGWFKPDLVTSGRSVVSLRVPGSTIDTANPSARIGTGNFVGSGTSFSAAITSGAAAILRQMYPGANPDRIKGVLLAGASAGPVGNPFVDGFGSLNVLNASTVTARLRQVAPTVATPLGSTVSLFVTGAGSAWNGSSWNGSSWNGSSWNGSAWTGSSWNGSSWNGSAWNGSAWNGSSWNGYSWNGSSWNGSAWNGSAWNGSSWNGSSWNGSSWNGSSWNGSSWN
jgi:serine protease AprX